MNYKLDLTQDEIQLICNALGELPLRITLNAFSKIQNQVQEQDSKNAVPIDSLINK